MPDRTVAGAVAAVVAVLTLLQLLWMFGMMSPASVMGGHANGAFYGSMIAAWFFGTFAILVAAAIALLLTRDDTTRT